MLIFFHYFLIYYIRKYTEAFNIYAFIFLCTLLSIMTNTTEMGIVNGQSLMVLIFSNQLIYHRFFASDIESGRLGQWLSNSGHPAAYLGGKWLSCTLCYHLPVWSIFGILSGEWLYYAAIISALSGLGIAIAALQAASRHSLSSGSVLLFPLAIPIIIFASHHHESANAVAILCGFSCLYCVSGWWIANSALRWES